MINGNDKVVSRNGYISANGAPAPAESSLGRMTARDFLHSIFKRFRLFIGLPLLIIILIVVASLIIPPVYEAQTSVRVADTDYENAGLIAGQRQSQPDMFVRKEQQINSEIRIATSSEVIHQVVRQLRLWEKWPAPMGADEDGQVSAAMDRVAENMTVEPARDSWVINISYRDNDAELAAEIANAIADQYIRHNISMSTLPEASEFHLEQLNKEQAELADMLARFRSLKETEVVVSYDAEVEQDIINLAEYKKQLTQVETDIMAKRAKIEAINSYLEENPDKAIPIPEYARIRIIEDLNYRVANIRLEYLALRQKYTDSERQVVNARRQLEEVTEQLHMEVQKVIEQETNELVQLEGQRDALQAAIADLKQELLDVQGIEAEYKTLEQSIEDKRSIITDLDRKYRDSLIAGQTDERLVAVKKISTAVAPTSPIFPNLVLNLMLGIPIALMLGFAAVIFFDYFDRTLQTPERAARVLRVPVLATINQMDMHRTPIFR